MITSFWDLFILNASFKYWAREICLDAFFPHQQEENFPSSIGTFIRVGLHIFHDVLKWNDCCHFLLMCNEDWYSGCTIKNLRESGIENRPVSISWQEWWKIRLNCMNEYTWTSQLVFFLCFFLKPSQNLQQNFECFLKSLSSNKIWKFMWDVTLFFI